MFFHFLQGSCEGISEFLLVFTIVNSFFVIPGRRGLAKWQNLLFLALLQNIYFYLSINFVVCLTT